MIPSYLNSLAATVRDLVASGKAVHVTNETAAELDLLAGLPWADALLHDPSSEDGTDFRCNRCGVGLNDEDIGQSITPADLALGWLLASRALSQGQIWHDNEITCKEVLTSDRQRAAECAELAVICERNQAEPMAHITLADGRIPIYRGMTGDLITRLLIGTGSGATASGNASQPSLSPHDGTREGARAAWGFVVQFIEMQQRNSMVAHAFEGKPQTWQAWQGMRDRYRRELEAMR